MDMLPTLIQGLVSYINKSYVWFRTYGKSQNIFWGGGDFLFKLEVDSLSENFKDDSLKKVAWFCC